MAQTPEGKVKAAVKKVLTDSKQWGSIYQFWPVQTGYGASTLDCLGCYQGRAFAIETKAPGKKPNKRQAMVIREMEAADMTVFVIDGEEGLGDLRMWLEWTRDAELRADDAAAMDEGY